MIRMPRRSVTRFFIPLIDVLILLFCIFLLMEFNSNSDLDKQFEITADQSESIDTLQVEVQRRTRELALFEDLRPQLQELAKLRKELDDLKNTKQKNLQDRTYIRIIDIDNNDGSISFYDDSKDKPIKIDGVKVAQELIERHQAEAKERDLYYVFIPPRDRRFPTLGQVRRYKDWFSKAATSGLAPLGGVTK